MSLSPAGVSPAAAIHSTQRAQHCLSNPQLTVAPPGLPTPGLFIQMAPELAARAAKFHQVDKKVKIPI